MPTKLMSTTICLLPTRCPMRKISEHNEKYGAVRATWDVEIECSKDELREVRQALAVLAKVEKATGLKRRIADWTMIHNYRFLDRDGRLMVTIEQGSCG